jgi:glycosyltransferase involved in cell wall biosynthesis
MGRICITYRLEPERDRWLPGDRWLRPAVRRIVRGARRPGGLDKVFINLRLGLDRLGIPYEVNLPFARMRPDDLVGVLGLGRGCLKGYARREPLVAGIGLMTHPSEWPTLFEDYPVACYLQHSPWTEAVYRRYFGDRCGIWPVGIDTVGWAPERPPGEKSVDFLVYDKIPWDRENLERDLLHPIVESLRRAGHSFTALRYGSYQPSEYRAALGRCRAMIFLSPHESQGIACEEAMSAGVPVLAWDPGFCQDPERFRWNDPVIATTSVPYFDERCGRRFADYAEFCLQLPLFMESLTSGAYSPRDYVLENLTVEKCSKRFVDILREKLP